MEQIMATIGNYDALTGENQIIELSDADLKKIVDAVTSEDAKRVEAKAKAEADKAAILAKIGLTADEVKLLLS
jgi:hypothetical protein